MQKVCPPPVLCAVTRRHKLADRWDSFAEEMSLYGELETTGVKAALCEISVQLKELQEHRRTMVSHAGAFPARWSHLCVQQVHYSIASAESGAMPGMVLALRTHSTLEALANEQAQQLEDRILAVLRQYPAKCKEIKDVRSRNFRRPRCRRLEPQVSNDT